METKIKSLALSICLISLLVVTTSSDIAVFQYEGLTVIANSGSTPESVTQKEFDKIIHGEQQRWKTGQNVSIALLKTNNSIGLKTAELVFDMSSNELNKYWLGLVFEGKSKAPEFFNSEEDLINYVAITPGAVGIISSSTKTSKVTMIKLD